jgi:hypothetical protein
MYSPGIANLWSTDYTDFDADLAVQFNLLVYVNKRVFLGAENDITL